MQREHFKRACEAWRRYCERHYLCYEQPSWPASDVSDTTVVLRNTYRELAHYHVATGRIRRPKAKR